ncbi:MAG: hypothetical protein FJZ49_02910 [Candidatus Verstraetearchaeota archaeon]|nr:hypothetical protein [Candidatus Verstraetearchaeota archaeon]
MGPLVLGTEQMEPLLRTKDLLEELIETMDIMSDRNLMEAIRRGEDDLKAGRTRDYGEFIEELMKSNAIQAFLDKEL